MGLRPQGAKIGSMHDLSLIVMLAAALVSDVYDEMAEDLVRAVRRIL
jgi:hypothetical protein